MEQAEVRASSLRMFTSRLWTLGIDPVPSVLDWIPLVPSLHDAAAFITIK